ncbi:MAG: acylphosphatase [Rhodanobacter sp.]|nr:MAG: acylphosphatase [Rhodanobacter sp.]TAL98401.1 MAG: acylphosphatase [Rhodanobacter sp.]TAM42104.1 MAG: acylphosphatase [Rhodanobacter sp.]TAN28123.1 MAG: acylphosphatase [Rhodanobacter sp.]
MPTARFIVSGRVQGVFFRASTRERALGLGLTGHAKNLDDGRVEVLASGSADALEVLEQWLQQGPPVARVEQVFRENLTEQDLFGFITG